MAGHTRKPLSVFGQQLEPLLAERQLSLRKLGRRLDPEKPERGRRDLVRWRYLGEGHHRPTRENRDRVAEALGVSPSVFDTEDEPEADALARALVLAIQGVVTQARSPATV